MEAQLSVVAAELRHERGADGWSAAVDRAVELVIHRVVGHERHDAVEVLAVERLGEANHQIGERLTIHHYLPPECSHLRRCASAFRAPPSSWPPPHREKFPHCAPAVNP